MRPMTPQATTKALDRDGWKDADLAALPTGELARLSALLSVEEETVKARRERLYKILHDRFADGLQPGTHYTDSQGRKLRVEVPKKVEWDQEHLKGLAEQIKRKMGEDPKDYIDFKLFVPENRFKAWPSAIQAMFEPARTVSPGKARIVFLETDAPK